MVFRLFAAHELAVGFGPGIIIARATLVVLDFFPLAVVRRLGRLGGRLDSSFGLPPLVFFLFLLCSNIHNG